MARPRSPNQDRAYEIYKEHDGNITNREIAAMLGEDEKVVAVWKSRGKWNVVQQSKKSCTTKAKGGQPGNRNAVGHGGTGPPGNKNAVTTGEFETLFFDTLEDDERLLIGMIQPDKEKLLLQEIQLLTVRERRMLKRIEDLRDCDFTTVKKKKGTEKDKWTDLKEDQAVLGQIQSIEDALTRVQGRKQRAIESLHKFGFDDARLEIELMKVELATLKIGGQEAGQEDDGFLAALNTEAESLWEAGADDN
ncbi:phage terminase small subunit [Hungatella hathewayi]|uniref:phage terminase small subunit n=1 Tax=Hungatella hathewayi TaxID=154046 RepID=UPI00242B947C|nr:phage terminase small subunit [Hungatella hathewayi]